MVGTCYPAAGDGGRPDHLFTSMPHATSTQLSPQVVLGIPGSQGDDCALSFFCTPCTIIQLVGTLWTNPKEVPGCSMDKAAAYVV